MVLLELELQHPQLLLHDINSSTGDTNVYIKTLSNNLGNTQILFGDSDRNDSGKVQYNHPENFLAFHTNSSEQVRITSNGSVGIGTTNPDGLDLIQNLMFSTNGGELELLLDILWFGHKY